MYLLDTNHCSRIISGDAALLQMLQHHLEEGVATSAIARGELLYMVYKSARMAENFRTVNAFLQTMGLSESLCRWSLRTFHSDQEDLKLFKMR